VTAPLVWRASVAARVGAVVLGVFFTGLGVSIATGSVESDPGGVAGLLCSIGFVLGGILGPWLFAFRPRVILGETTVTIVNPLRETSLRLDRVRGRPQPGYFGVTVAAVDDGQRREVTAWAVQKSNLATWFGREVRADYVGRAIAEAAALAQRPAADR